MSYNFICRIPVYQYPEFSIIHGTDFSIVSMDDALVVWNIQLEVLIVPAFSILQVITGVSAQPAVNCIEIGTEG